MYCFLFELFVYERGLWEFITRLLNKLRKFIAEFSQIEEFYLLQQSLSISVVVEGSSFWRGKTFKNA